ncbi:hypothetical protein G7Y89_g14379 [Cudoniella acicularis]|uniref:Uncharacterized protein n=1 Tax=Cudoniella acicularis TaxID=354080 RepID=A0A8H4R4B9_9HELO|nr:hypothetical protein G7Y89_g14379 [Cudoniella acicularis]
MEPQEYSLDLSNVCLDLNDNDEYSEFMDSYTSHDFPFLTSITNNSHNTLEISSNADSLNSLDDSTSWVFDPQYQDLEPDSDRRANSFPSTSTVFDQTLNQIQDHEPKDLCSTTKRNNKPGRGFTEYVFRTEFKSTRTPRKGSFIPKRRGPLAPKTREVAKEIRSIGACWRCKILKTSVRLYFTLTAAHLSMSTRLEQFELERSSMQENALTRSSGQICAMYIYLFTAARKKELTDAGDMIVPAPRTSLLLPENSQIMVFAVKDLDEIFRGIEEFREACCIPRREGTSDLFELLRCAMVYQEITSETDLIRHAMHCLRACLRIRHSQEHRQSPHTVHPNDSTLKIQEYREIRDSVRFYLRKLQCTMFVRGEFTLRPISDLCYLAPLLKNLICERTVMAVSHRERDRDQFTGPASFRNPRLAGIQVENPRPCTAMTRKANYGIFHNHLVR